MSSSLDSRTSAAVIITAGRMPEDPAVGAAQIFPMEALTSDVENALAMRRFMVSPQIDRPFLR